MPEGPTVRVTTDLLRATLEGRRIEQFRSSFKKAAAEDWVSKVTGQRVRRVRAHGKNMFIDLDNGWTIYSHFLMWGAWHVYRRDEPWLKEARKARVVIETATDVAVLFSAPVCELIHADDLPQHPTSELGPDLMADDFDDDDKAEAHRRIMAQGATPIGAAIMIQMVVAGIGNILKSEILFAIGVHPQRPADSLTPAEFEQFIDRSQYFMHRAYETHGFQHVFLPPTLQKATGKLGYVYQRSGQPCLRCGNTVQMVRQGQLERMTFFCPHCQPLDPLNPPQLEEPRMLPPYANTARTLEDARQFVLDMGMIGILHDAKGKLPTLWDAVDFPDKQPGEGGWGEKMGKVWTWKNELPSTYPTDVFYGKIKGGRAVLMSMAKLHELYAKQHKPIEECSTLAQELYEVIRQGPIMTVPLRQLLGMTDRKARAPFDRALQELQVTFNIARLNRADVEGDTWVPFGEQYPEFN